MSGQPIGVSVVGMGTIGRRHVEVMGRLDGAVRLVAVSGGRSGTLAELGHGGVERLTPKAAIAHPDVDLVVLCTPSGLHGEQALATLRFASGALGVVVTSTATPPGRPAAMALYTSGGSGKFSDDAVTRWDFGEVPPPDSESVSGSGASDPLGIGVAGHLAQWRDIINALRTGRPPAVTARDGLATVRLLCAIYEAAETGRTVSLAGAA